MDHTVIYLAPPCFGDERHWCEDDAPVDCECDDGPHPWIKFAAEQVVQELRAENAHSRQLGREEGARMMQEAAKQICYERVSYLEGNELYPAYGLNSQVEGVKRCLSMLSHLDPAQVVKGDARSL